MNLFKFVKLRGEWRIAECLPLESTGKLYCYNLLPDEDRKVYCRDSDDIEAGYVIRPPNHFCEIHDSPDAFDRSDLGLILNGHGLRGTAVEIGTHRGEFSSKFLAKWQSGRLICVDPWDNATEDYSSLQQSLLPHAGLSRADDFAEARRVLFQFKDRCALWKVTSESAASAMGDGELDFVYIDGDHRRRFVEQDLRLWWPKIVPGGIMALHDWTGEWEHDVRPAIEEFCEQKCIKCCHIIPGDAASAYFSKPK